MIINGLISIIVPVYKVEQYLERCLNSLLNQTYENIEIILIDDGSPDNCPSICDEYYKRDNRIKVIHKENAGLGMARNSGLEIASGEYIAFVDSDDYVTENMCEILYAEATKYSADVVYGGVHYLNHAKNKRKNIESSKMVWKGEKEVREFLLDIIGTKPSFKSDTIIEVSVWKALFKKTMFDTYNIKFVSEREYISEDVIFDIDFLQFANCVVVIPDVVYYYTDNPYSLSKVFRPDRFQQVLVLYHEMIRRLRKIYTVNELKLPMGRFLIARARTNIRQVSKRSKIIGKKTARKIVKDIVNNKDLQNVLSWYPIKKMPLKYRIITFLMKYRIELLLNILLKV